MEVPADSLAWVHGQEAPLLPPTSLSTQLAKSSSLRYRQYHSLVSIRGWGTPAQLLVSSLSLVPYHTWDTFSVSYPTDSTRFGGDTPVYRPHLRVAFLLFLVQGHVTYLILISMMSF